jgi:hypothetical protein
MPEKEETVEKVTGLDTLSPKLRRLYEESVQENEELLKELAKM